MWLLCGGGYAAACDGGGGCVRRVDEMGRETRYYATIGSTFFAHFLLAAGHLWSNLIGCRVGDGSGVVGRVDSHRRNVRRGPGE